MSTLRNRVVIFSHCEQPLVWQSCHAIPLDQGWLINFALWERADFVKLFEFYNDKLLISTEMPHITFKIGAIL